MIKISVYTKDQNTMIDHPAYRLIVEGLNLQKIAYAIEDIAQAIEEEEGGDK